jgi:hypothetical protein
LLLWLLWLELILELLAYLLRGLCCSILQVEPGISRPRAHSDIPWTLRL